jgi:hypothetical protein
VVFSNSCYTPHVIENYNHKGEILLRKYKAVAYFITNGNHHAMDFYDSIWEYCQKEKEKTDGFEEIELLAIFHDIDKTDGCDDLPAWDQFITFLAVNKEVSKVLLPQSRYGAKFNGADYLLDISEFMNIPPVTSFFIYENNYDDLYEGFEEFEDNEDNEGSANEDPFAGERASIDISSDDLPF